MAVAEADTVLAAVATWANGGDSGNGGADNNQQTATALFTAVAVTMMAVTTVALAVKLLTALYIKSP